jgi:hypothetical protein
MSVDVSDQLNGESRETRLEVATAALIMALLQILLSVISLQHGWTLWGLGGWIWLIPVVPELLLAIMIGAEDRGGNINKAGERRNLVVVLLIVAGAFNASALVLLSVELFTGDVKTGGELAVEALLIWCTLVLTFAMLFWDLDGGGPRRRASEPDGRRDFLFSEMTAAPKLVAPGWHSRLLDYSYLSFTTAIAWSPAEVVPLSRKAKVMMAIETVLSVLTILLGVRGGTYIIG